jgi:hypothetical protein
LRGRRDRAGSIRLCRFLANRVDAPPFQVGRHSPIADASEQRVTLPCLSRSGSRMPMRYAAGSVRSRIRSRQSISPSNGSMDVRHRHPPSCACVVGAQGCGLGEPKNRISFLDTSPISAYVAFLFLLERGERGVYRRTDDRGQGSDRRAGSGAADSGI